MAWSKVETKIANPAGLGGRSRKSKKNHMAKTKKRRNLSAKQIRAGFGGARRKAALKAHRPRTKKRNAAASRPRPKKKSSSSHRPRTKKKNPELVSFLLGNSAKKRSSKKMASHKHKSKKSAASHRGNAGRPRKKKSMTGRRRKSNPSPIGSPMMWVKTGAGALAGFVGSAALPHLVAPNSNTGMTGYALAAGAAIGLGFLSHFLLPRQPQITVGVVAGGFANLIRRVITDQTPFGSYLNAPAAQGGMGMGDYMVANWGPPRMTDGLHSAMAEAAGTPWGGGAGGMITASSGVQGQDMVDIRASRPC